MITIDEIRQKLDTHASRLREFHVSHLWLFGSAARQEPSVRDLDFLVEFSTPPGLMNFMELKFFLEETFGLPVDLHTRRSCPQRFYERIREDLQHVA